MLRCKNLLEAMGKVAPERQQLFLRTAFNMRCGDFIESYGTSDFTNLMLDASHKRNQKMYEGVPVIWPMLMSVDNDVMDFKAHHIIGDGEFGDLDLVGQGAPYNEDSFTDKGASLSVGKYGKIFGISLEATVNDELGRLNRVSGKLLKAAARTLDKHAVQTMIQADPVVQEDGLVLFNAAHINDHGTATGYNRANLIGSLDLYANQVGIDGEPVAVAPKYLMVRSNKQIEAMEDVTSQTKISIDQAASATQVQGVRNALSNLNLQVITSPYITTDAFYLLSDPQAYDGLVVGFLRGKQQPELLAENKDSGMSFTTDTSRFKIRHTWGTVWSDYRVIVRGGV